MTTYVSPQSANIERIDLIGKKSGVEILMSEQVTSQTIPKAIAEDTYTFIPPR